MANIAFKIKRLYTNKNMVYKILGTTLIVLGVIGVTYPFWNISLAPMDNPIEELGQSEIQSQVATAESPTPTNAVKNQPIIQNRLIIESAGVNMPLFLSNNDKTLLKGGWMYSGNSTPDKGGNTVIFGHRWLYKPPIKNTFFNLDKTKIGDKFNISWNGTNYNYQVSEIKIIDPTEISILNPTNFAQVTLITCTPLFSTKQRLIVIGKLI